MDANINRDAKKTIYLAVFWFGHSHEYNAVLVGPFGNELHQEEQMMTVKIWNVYKCCMNGHKLYFLVVTRA